MLRAEAGLIGLGLREREECRFRDQLQGCLTRGAPQVTFFLAMAVAGRLGTATLAAHQVVAQLWMLTSYVVDGFAVAGTVLGSRLAPLGPAGAREPWRGARPGPPGRRLTGCQADAAAQTFCDLITQPLPGYSSVHALPLGQLWTPLSICSSPGGWCARRAWCGFFASGVCPALEAPMRALLSRRGRRRFARLARRVLLLGVAVGGGAGAALNAWRDPVIALFTGEPGAVAVLRGPVWALLCAMQPVNGAVFVYDGLLYATQSFAWVRARARNAAGGRQGACDALPVHECFYAMQGRQAGATWVTGQSRTDAMLLLGYAVRRCSTVDLRSLHAEGRLSIVS